MEATEGGRAMTRQTRAELWSQAWTDGFEQGKHYADLGEQAPAFYVIPDVPKPRTSAGRVVEWIRRERVVVYPTWLIVVIAAAVAGAAIRTAEWLIGGLG